MDYLRNTEYFPEEDQAEEDDAPLQQYLSVELPQHEGDTPDLDEFPFPFDDEKKMDSTLENTQEYSKELQSETTPQSPILPLPTVRGRILFPQNTVDRYRTVFRGTKDDTVELNINFKTLLVQYFRESIKLNELNQTEIRHVEEFSERVPSFNSLMLFFQPKPQFISIRERALELFSSKECIKRILLGRCKMRNKLQMIKFIEKVRLNILTDRGYKWKDVIKPPPYTLNLKISRIYSYAIPPRHFPSLPQ